MAILDQLSPSDGTLVGSMTDDPIKRIVIVDDHPALRMGLRALLNDEPGLTVIGEAADLPTALRLIGEVTPDLVVADISLSDGNGLELVKQITQWDPPIRSIVLSMYDDSIYAERAVRAGAMGYINKSRPSDEIVRAIRHALAGRIALSDDITENVLQRLRQRADDRDPVDRLTDREVEVLTEIGRGLTTRQIAERLHVAVKTIETHKENLKQKLDLGSAAELARFAVQWLSGSEA